MTSTFRDYSYELVQKYNEAIESLAKSLGINENNVKEYELAGYDNSFYREIRYNNEVLASIDIVFKTDNGYTAEIEVKRFTK